MYEPPSPFVPRRLEILASRVPERLLALLSLLVFGIKSYLEPAEDFAGWVDLAAVWLLPGLLGTLVAGWAITRWVGRGTIRCPSCRKLTKYYPAPTQTPGMSTPHLRCDRCGDIIWGL